MRIQIEKWLSTCDSCKKEIEPGEGISGLGGGRTDYAIFETPFGCIYADEDNCWCDIQCLINWIFKQYGKLRA